MVILQHPLALLALILIPVLAITAWRLAPRIGPIRAWSSWAVRCVLITLLTLALAQPLLPRGTDDVTVAVIMDRSRSVSDAGREAAVAWLSKALHGDERTGGDRVALVHVAAEAVPGAMPDPASEVSLSVSPGPRDASDLYRGIELARAMLPQDTRNRLLLVSDGLDTEGTLSAAESTDSPIDVLVLPVDRARDVRIERIAAPGRAERGAIVDMDVVVHAAAPASGRIVVRRNGMPVSIGAGGSASGLPVQLPAGTTVLNLQVVAGDDLTRLEATWIPDNRAGDAPENDHGRAVVLSARTGTVMLVSEQPDAVAGLLRILQDSGFNVRTGTPADLAQGGAVLASIDGLVLVDVPRWSLPSRFDTLLATWVESTGGGLLMTGGASALGAGGWIGSDVERVLPVQLDPPAQRQIQRGALVLVMHACEMERGNYWGRVICETAIDALTAKDLVGIVEFNPASGSVEWALPLQPAGDKTEALRAAGRLRYGDMPDFAPSMELAVQALADADAGQRHMVIISDGDPQPPSVALLERMHELDIPASTVLVGGHGRPEDQRRMEHIAVATGGEFHRVTDPDQLPRIMIEAAQLAARSFVQQGEVPVEPTPSAAGPLAGCSVPPPVDAYVLCAARGAPASTPWVLSAEEGTDPLVAWWHQGNGRAAVITVPPDAGWTGQWTSWPDHDRLWIQLVRWLRPSPDDGAWALHLREGDGGRVEVSLEAAVATTQEVLPSASAVVLAPDGSTRRMELHPTGPGRAAGVFTMDMPGEWLAVAAVDVSESDAPMFLRSALSQAWPDEDRAEHPDIAALERLAAATGGRVHRLSDTPEAAGLFDRAGLSLLVAPSPIWPWLVIAAAILLPIDVAVRRLVLRRASSSVQVSTPAGHATQASGAAAPPPAPRHKQTAVKPADKAPGQHVHGQSTAGASESAPDDSESAEQDAMERLRRARREGRGESENLS